MKRKGNNQRYVLGAATLAALLLFTGCGGKQSKNDSKDTTQEKNEVTTDKENGVSSGLDEGGVTNREGYPITKEPITIKAAVKYNSLRPDQDTTEVWKYIADKTNINVEVEQIKDDEKVDLMFAGDTLPDLIMNVGIKPNHMTNAVEGGSFVEIDKLMNDYAPTWNQFIHNNKLTYNASLASNGKLYGLPYIDFAPFDRNLRDQWIIMKTWLDELNLPVPKTTDEFENTLQLIKDNAGKGSIPQDVIPYYFLFDSYVGGQFDIYGSFGVYVTSADYIYVDNGKVKDQSINPAIKEPLKYLNRLYSKGLIPPEVFTDDWNAYVSKISSDPAIVATYHSYANRHMKDGIAMGPLDACNGETPLMRSQAYMPSPDNAAIITKNNKYPIATMRLLEAIASDTDMMMTVSRGIKGDVWDYDKDGKAYAKFWEESPDKMSDFSKELGLHNSFIALKDQKFYENIWDEVSYNEKNSRAWAYKNIYEKSVMPNDMVYVEGNLGEDDTNRISILAEDLSSYRKTVFADFITGKKDINKDWDSYVNKMNSLGLDEFIELKQKAYDLLQK